MANFSRLIETAKIFKLTKQTGRSFHVAYVLKGRKVIAVGFNNFNKTNRVCYDYKPTRKHLPDYRSIIHAEPDATAKIKNRTDIKDLTLVSIRINNHNNPDYAEPCPNCAFHLGKLGIKHVFYTTESGTFAQLKE